MTRGEHDSETALERCEKFLRALAEPAAPGGGEAWPTESTLGVATELYGPGAVRALLADGLAYAGHVLLGYEELPALTLVEGVLRGEATGPRPFSVAWERSGAPRPLNVLRGGSCLTSTGAQAEALGRQPRRPEPALQGPATERLAREEEALLRVLARVASGWRSAPGAVALWRRTVRGTEARLRPPDKALLGAICHFTGPWRLTPLLSGEQGAEWFGVPVPDLEAAEAWLRRSLQPEGESLRYLPQMPEGAGREDVETERGLRGLVQAFLGELEEPDTDTGKAPEPRQVPEAEGSGRGGTIPLFPADG